jgi:hypothetical protein
MVYVSNIYAVCKLEDNERGTLERTQIRPFGFTESNIGISPELMCSTLIFSDGCPFTDFKGEVVLTVLSLISDSVVPKVQKQTSGEFVGCT